MKFIKRIIHTIITGYKTKKVYGYEAYAVYWDARYGGYYDSKKRVLKVFTNKDDAKEFAKSLEEAQKLLQYEEYINIKIEKIS